jgi:GNAT superfamily N-acetyltransferase
VLADGEDVPIAFALYWRCDEALHLRELDVDPDHMRRGLGRRLVEHVCTLARATGRPAVTLTTFADVPFNAPLYRRYGFSDLPPADQPPWLRAIRDAESRGPLRHWPRLAMRRCVD